MAMVAHRFDVYLVNLDPDVGSEIRKTRPGVINARHHPIRSASMFIAQDFTKAAHFLIIIDMVMKNVAKPA